MAAALLAVEDTWVPADTRGAGTCMGRTHTGGSRSSKVFPDPSSLAGTRTAAHTRIAAHTDTHAAADTHAPPSLSAEHVERAKQVKHGNPACALQGIAARWLSAHYKDIARHSARYGSGSWVRDPMS